MNNKKMLTAVAIMAVAALVMITVPTSESDGTTDVSNNLNTAINSASSGDTLRLTGDVTEDVVVAGKTIVIDLNGHKITNLSGHTITVKDDANLTIVDTSQGKTGTVDNTTRAKAALAIYSGNTVTLKGGTFERSLESSANSWYTIKNHGDLTIDGATVLNKGSSSSNIANGWYNGSATSNPNGNDLETYQGTPARLHIINGTIDGGLNSVKNDDAGELNISGGIFTNTAQSAIFNCNKTTISGGSFTTSANVGVVSSCYYDNNGMNEGILIISGGTFTGNIIVQRIYNGDNLGSIDISGGTFNAPTIFKIGNDANPDITVSGGKFSSTFDDSYFSEDCTIVPGKDGSFEVVDIKDIPNKPEYPEWDDEDEYFPPIIIPSTPAEKESNDDSTTVVACAAAAAVAALMAVFLIVDRRKN